MFQPHSTVFTMKLNASDVRLQFFRADLSLAVELLRADQNIYYVEPDFGVPGFVLLKLC